MNLNQITIGVLSLQGCVTPHFPHIEALGANGNTNVNVRAIHVKREEDFAQADAFILPGGESTTMWKNIDNFQLFDVMRENFQQKPVWGICAGSILMARKVLGREQRSFHLGEFDVERNAYGRQVESREVVIKGYPVTFIRAPKLNNVDLNQCEVLAAEREREGEGGRETPVWISWKGQYMATTFHPELTEQYPSLMHQTFLEMILQFKKRPTL
jgi:5'-phosphate synthase pdxT subunit